MAIAPPVYQATENRIDGAGRIDGNNNNNAAGAVLVSCEAPVMRQAKRRGPIDPVTAYRLRVPAGRIAPTAAPACSLFPFVFLIALDAEMNGILELMSAFFTPDDVGGHGLGRADRCAVILRTVATFRA